MWLDRLLMYVGRTLLGAGLLVLLFLGYQLYGTGLTEARQQDRLQAEAEALFARTAPVAATPARLPDSPETAAPTTTPPVIAAPVPQGSAVAVLRIPKISITKAVVSGTSVTDLKKGPGHYIGTPLPGQPGNAAIAGHRTTYGAPFGRLDELAIGDEMDVTTRQGTFVYRVKSKQIVSPQQNSVLAPTTDNRLTLTTCHPRYSDAQRLIVVAELAPGAVPAPAPPTTAPPSPPQADLASEDTQLATATTPVDVRLEGAELTGDEVRKTPTIIWGLLTLLVGVSIYALGRTWRRIPAYLVGAPVFLATLFVFFETVNRLLPASA